MNCCKQDHNENTEKNEHKEHDSHQGRHRSHMWMMLLCCGLPLLAIASLPIIDRFIPGSSDLIRWAIPFICPLMMLPMMLGGLHDKREEHAKSDHQKHNQEDRGNYPGSCH